jgi:hypothetical protein
VLVKLLVSTFLVSVPVNIHENDSRSFSGPLFWSTPRHRQAAVFVGSSLENSHPISSAS